VLSFETPHLRREISTKVPFGGAGGLIKWSVRDLMRNLTRCFYYQLLSMSFSTINMINYKKFNLDE
jgi:hypothetical protein